MQDFEVTKLNPYFVNNQRTLSVNKKDESDCPTLAVTVTHKSCKLPEPYLFPLKHFFPTIAETEKYHFLMTEKHLVTQ